MRDLMIILGCILLAPTAIAIASTLLAKSIQYLINYFILPWLRIIDKLSGKNLTNRFLAYMLRKSMAAMQSRMPPKEPK